MCTPVDWLCLGIGVGGVVVWMWNRCQEIIIPVTMLISSSWLRWLDDPSERLELAELNGCSDGHGDGGPPERNNIVVVPQPMPDRRRGLYRGGPRKGTAKRELAGLSIFMFLFIYVFLLFFFFCLFVCGVVDVFLLGLVRVFFR